MASTPDWTDGPCCRLCCRGTIEIRTRSRCFADIFRATRTGADVGLSRRGRNRTYLIRFVGAAHLPVCHSTCLLLTAVGMHGIEPLAATALSRQLVYSQPCGNIPRSGRPGTRTLNGFTRSCLQNSVLIQPDTFRWGGRPELNRRQLESQPSR